MNIGETIKKYRKKNDLTQEKLADFLCVSYQAVSKWETGISSPDLSLIAPLSRLLKISADELLGLTEHDERRDELESAYDNTWKTGDLNERYKIAEAIVKEYPGEMKYLDWLAWITAMRSFDFKDDATYIAEQEKAIKMFAAIIENCSEDKIKNSAICGITQYLQFRGKLEEARKYAELYPDDNSFRKDEILLHCLSGDERTRHCQKMLMNSLFTLLSRLDNVETLQSWKLGETLVKLFITDENYLDFHHILYTCLKNQAHHLTREKRYGEAVYKMERALYHAQEYDKIDAANGQIFKYTTAMFDMLECDTAKIMRSGTTTFTEHFYEWLENNFYDPLRNRDDFKKFAEKK
jgi:transcriptional regulator with XRE-family HTH domain